jgi:hypothetical protein
MLFLTFFNIFYIFYECVTGLADFQDISVERSEKFEKLADKRLADLEKKLAMPTSDKYINLRKLFFANKRPYIV